MPRPSSELVLRIPALAAEAGLVHGFSTVALGSMRDPSARARFAAELGVAGEPALAGAVHGCLVAPVEAAGGVVAGTDGLVSDRPGVALLAMFADCYPLIAFDPVRGAAGLAHAGWRGTEAGIARRLVDSLRREFGCRPEDMLAGIGPGICGRCYEVGPEVATRFPPGLSTASRAGRRHLDLAAANREQLLEAGLRPERIAREGTCTLESSHLFSHRRQPDGGRFACLVAIR